MDTFDLKKEQLKLAGKVVLNDGFSTVKTVGGAACFPLQDKLLACVVVCSYPELELLEKKYAVLNNPLPFISGFSAYREMPAIIEAYNELEQEPDLLCVVGSGRVHPRRLGIASHLGLALNTPCIGVAKNLLVGHVEQGKIHVGNEIAGFQMTTKEHAKPLFVSPGHLVSLGSTLRLMTQMVKPPHKMPEPLHVAHKYAKKKAGKMSRSLHLND
jgi:deoxyribonuclease V